MIDDKYYKDLNNTYKWSSLQLEILKINFKDGELKDIIGDININNVILNEDIERILLPGINIIINDKLNINKKQLPFYNRLNQIIRFPDKPPVFSVIYDLLTWIGFEDVNIHFRPQPKLRMRWKDYNISSNADFCVYYDMLNHQTFIEYIIIIEAKKENSECQLAGEMLLSAYNRFEDIQKDNTVYGIIIKSSLIRFYKVIFSKLYLQEIQKSKNPTISIEPLTYPPQSEIPLSLNIPNQREKIIRILYILKQKTEELININYIL